MTSGASRFGFMLLLTAAVLGAAAIDLPPPRKPAAQFPAATSPSSLPFGAGGPPG